MRLGLLFSLALLLLCPLSQGAPEASASGKTGRVLVLLEPGCPIARYHLATLRELHEAFAEKGIVFQGYVPNVLATEASVAGYREKFEIPFPVEPDPQQRKAAELGATIVPEVFVYDAKEALIYRGRIDDKFAAVGKRRPRTRSHDLKRTLIALLEGKPLPSAQTEPVGCPITFSEIPNTKS